MDKRNVWLDGILGVVTGDALGVPVEFCSRSEIDANPVEGMRAYGTFHLPAGSWSDDSSLTLAALDSLGSGKLDLDDVMRKFADWLFKGAYTPWGTTFDVGRSCMLSISRYSRGTDIHHCGSRGADENGNGSLMRIMPFVLYAYQQNMNDEDAVRMIEDASSLTHAHLRSRLACGLYFFMARKILNTKGTLRERMQKGLDEGFCFYGKKPEYTSDLAFYHRIRNLELFKATPREQINSSGYVVDSLEAAIWSLLNTVSYEECELMAVNLGDDTDSVAAIAGGLAGLYYSHKRIPTEWLDTLAKKDWIIDLCRRAGEANGQEGGF